MLSKIYIQRPISAGILTVPINDFSDLNTNTQAGDCVVVLPGTYLIGNNYAELKEDVSWRFMPGVTISGTHANGVFYTDPQGTHSTIHWEGFPIIQHDDLKKRVVVPEATYVDDFYFEYIGIWSQSGTGNIIEDYKLKNTTGIDMFPAIRGSAGEYFFSTYVENASANGNHPSSLKFELIVNNNSGDLNKQATTNNGAPIYYYINSGFTGDFGTRSASSMLLEDNLLNSSLVTIRVRP